TFWNKKMAYTLMKKATQFIAISKCVENKYKAIVGHENIQCIYNGVDIETFYNKDHEILNDSNVVITMAGRITREKGQLLCLKELLPILKKNPNVILQFAGVGNENELNAIVELRNKEGISEEQVKFLGFVKEVNRLWSKTDIAIVYSKFEAFGRVTVEAKMAGALVVGFDSGGTSELIKNGVDGYLFDGNVCTLNQIVQMILSDKEKSKKVAREGRKSAAEIFTSENNAKQIWQLYKDILQV
ncbi:MAG: glycosyltransferase family 4 protein, partial [Veillonella sp.]